MPEPQIIDTSVITVKSTTKDQYGNLIVSPIEGADFKIASKRNNLFEVFQQGRAVKLFWAEYQHHKYVANAEFFDGKPPAEKQVAPITAGVSPQPLQAKTTPPKAESNISDRDSRIEEAVWWKELGNRIGDGSIDRDFPNTMVKVKSQYYKKLSEVTGVDFK